MEEQQAKHAAFKIYDIKDYFKEKSDEPIVLEEQEIAVATVENEDIEYLVDKYYKTYHIPQIAEEIKKEKEQEDSDFLQTATEYYYEEIKAANDIEKEEKRNLFIDATDANEDMAVDDKLTIDD